MNVAIFGYINSTSEIIRIIKSFGDQLLFLMSPNNRKLEKNIKKYCEIQKIKILTQPDKKDTKHEEFIKFLQKHKPDIAVSYSYSQIIPAKMINIFPKGIINIHGGLLPQYRGGNVLNWVLINGEKKTGVTIHYVDKGIDSGDIIAQRKIAISEKETALTLQNKIAITSLKLFKKTWPFLQKDKVKAIKQDKGQAKYWPARKPKDGKIDFKIMNKKQIYNLIRALVKPWPGAFYYKNGKKIIINKLIPLEKINKLK